MLGQSRQQTWKDKTCADCVFNVNQECRRFPPSAKALNEPGRSYPSTLDGTADVPIETWPENLPPMRACAEYKENILKGKDDASQPNAD